MIIDTHVYVWDKVSDPRRSVGAEQNWVPDSVMHRERTVSLSEVDADMTEANVAAVVLVQATNTLRHTTELLTEAASSPRPTKVVGWLPLAEPAETDSALRRFAHEPALAGVRHRLRDGEDPELLHTTLAAESLQMIAEAGLALDVLPWPPVVLSHVPALAEQHPELRIVIDLLGWPQIESRRMQPWTDHLAAAAAHPSVCVKVGGLYRMTGADIDSTAWEPYVATAVELFGPERIMIGSDWPALNVYGLRYADVVRATVGAFRDLTPSELADVQANTAARVYGFEQDR